MIFRLRPATGALASFVEFFWFFEDLAVDHSMEKLVPNAAMELIVDLTPTPKKLYDNKDLKRYRECRKAWVSGMQREYIIIGPEVGSSLIGVHFRTGGASPFFPFPVSELASEVVELDLIWTREILGLRDHLLEAWTVDEKFDVLECFLLAKAQARLNGDRAVHVAVGQLRHSPASPVRSVADHLGLSQKQLISLFDSHVGCSPKVTARIFRFQQALHSIHRSGEQDWAELALAHGYYDQSHLIHEFQHFAGLTPAEYARKRSPYPDYIVVA
jgi:AraC-like DNA-binding protein